MVIDLQEKTKPKATKGSDSSDIVLAGGNKLTTSEAEAYRAAKTNVEQQYAQYKANGDLEDLVSRLGLAEQKSRLTSDTIGAPIYAAAMVEAYLSADRISDAVKTFAELSKRRGQLNASIKSTAELLEEALALKCVSETASGRLSEIADLIGEVTKVTTGLIFVESTHTRLSMARIRLLCDLGRIKDAVGVAEFLSSDTAASLPYAERMMYLCEQISTVMDSGDLVKAFVMSDRVKENFMFNAMLAEEGLISSAGFTTGAKESALDSGVDNKKIVRNIIIGSDIDNESNKKDDANNENTEQQHGDNNYGCKKETAPLDKTTKPKVASMRLIRRQYYRLAARMHLEDRRWTELARVAWEFVATYYPVNTVVTRAYFVEHGTNGPWYDLQSLKPDEIYECAFFASTAAVALALTDIVTNEESKLMCQLMLQSSLFSEGGEVRRDFRPLARLINPFSKVVINVWASSSLCIWDSEFATVIDKATQFVIIDEAAQIVRDQLKSTAVVLFQENVVQAYTPIAQFSPLKELREFKIIDLLEKLRNKEFKKEQTKPLTSRKIKETWALFKERLIEKNMVLVCTNYSYTNITRVAELLNITKSEAEDALVKMSEHFLVSIDSPLDEVQFIKEKNGEDILVDWFLEIAAAVKNVNTVLNLIELEKQQ